jgi:hypothetical protein
MKKLDYFSQFIRWTVGLSVGAIPDNLWIGGLYPNSYAIPNDNECWLAGEIQQFELPEGTIRPRRNLYINVMGCGLVLDPEDKLWIFFTLNGQLLGKFWLLPVNRINKI